MSVVLMPLEKNLRQEPLVFSFLETIRQLQGLSIGLVSSGELHCGPSACEGLALKLQSVARPLTFPVFV